MSAQGSLIQKSATVVPPPRHMPTRQHSWAMALQAQEETAGLEKAWQRPGRNVYDRFEVLQRGEALQIGKRRHRSLEGR
jgi:hypothetical protein